MSRVSSLESRLVRIPLRRPWGADVTSVAVLPTRVELDDGAVGFGFSWTPTIGAEAVLALLQHDIWRTAIGRDGDPEAIWQSVWEHLHEAGGGGLTTIAIAGLDLALWDARARANGCSIADEIGIRRQSVEVYGSGVNLHYSTDELLAQVQRWIDAGHDAVKIKVGRPSVAEDVERVRAVRALLGDDRRLMIDANQRWDLERATAAMRELEAFDPAWIEEPLRAEDLPGHIALAERTAVPIAVGENLHTRQRFEEFLQSGAAGVVQPNIVRVGGITPFRRIAAIARDHGVPLHPHLLPELSGQLALTLDGDAAAGAVMVEDVEDAGFGELGALSGPSPVRIANSRLTQTGSPGLGLLFTEGFTS
ncbi:mandelate racemase/muconate lactonizing enzyme family protein [Leifsonia sp. Leaf264]|uniref:mandelate racemase/muconate lactonizing enzyme family protein n=1 Tax=Leifsonia sp. Leaf264 TaxID=1736314 RepID=UPI0007020E9C|nr:mandelate racemase/muconate lactonizing enzyme family protein [Leifsonia sp. Leaf264]KQO97050.1 racemase [Leifsonia sp. Leaf264]